MTCIHLSHVFTLLRVSEVVSLFEVTTDSGTQTEYGLVRYKYGAVGRTKLPVFQRMCGAIKKHLKTEQEKIRR